MSLQTPQKVMSANRTEQFAIKKNMLSLGNADTDEKITEVIENIRNILRSMIYK